MEKIDVELSREDSNASRQEVQEDGLGQEVVQEVGQEGGVGGDGDYAHIDFSPPSASPRSVASLAGSTPKDVLMVPVPPISKWRSSTRIIIIMDMVYSWVFIGFCGSFLTKISLALALIEKESQWSLETADYANVMMGTLGAILFVGIGKMMVGLWVGLQLMQAVNFANERNQVEALSKGWRRMNVISLIVFPLLILGVCGALYWIPPANQELLVMLAAFGIVLGYGFFWKMWTYYVVYMFISGL